MSNTQHFMVFARWKDDMLPGDGQDDFILSHIFKSIRKVAREYTR